jgi:microcystin-dependent protein
MSDPFLAEIRIFAGNFAPYQWATCNGQSLAISQNAALFSLIGTYYGGNGTSTFQLPNFQSTAPVAAGNGTGLTPRVIGEQGGETTVTLMTAQMPVHNHSMNAHGIQNGTANSPQGAALGQAPGNLFLPNNNVPITQMAPKAISPAGGSVAHNNVQPFLMLTFIIALAGIFPPRQ